MKNPFFIDIIECGIKVIKERKRNCKELLRSFTEKPVG